MYASVLFFFSFRTMMPNAPRQMADLPADKYPSITTQRLHLRPLSLTDAPQLYQMRSHAGMMRFVPRPLATSEAEIHDLITGWQMACQAGQSLHWAITQPPQNHLIGHMLLFNLKPEHGRGEIGYMMHDDYAGKGFTTEALQGVVQLAFGALGMHSLEAIIHPDNVASARVLQKAGFVQEAHFKENFFWAGKFEDSLVYSLVG